MDDSIKHSDEVESTFGLPLLGWIPLIKKTKGNSDAVALLAHTDPRSAFAEAYRYDFTEPKTIRAIFLQHGTWAGEAPADFILQGSTTVPSGLTFAKRQVSSPTPTPGAGRLLNLAFSLKVRRY